MNSRSDIICALNNLLKVTGFMAFFLLTPGLIWAQSSLKAKGEIVSASQTTINGFSAISGMTVFSNNRIMTGREGAAIINLGKLGRIELGAETDVTLRLSETSIAGDLHSSRLIVSARTGIAIAVNTGKDMVTTDGREAAVLTIYVDSKSKRTRVITHLGAASVISTGEDRAADGKDISQSPRGEGGLRAGAGLAAGAIGAASIAKIASKGSTAASNASSFAELFKAGINYSIDPKFDRGSGSKEPFETSMTCRDGDKKPCRKKSEYKPKRP
jgi:hypothetical protein